MELEDRVKRGIEFVMITLILIIMIHFSFILTGTLNLPSITPVLVIVLALGATICNFFWAFFGG